MGEERNPKWPSMGSRAGLWLDKKFNQCDFRREYFRNFTIVAILNWFLV